MPYQKKGSEVQRMFGGIAHRYDLCNLLLSFGICSLWNARLLREISPTHTIVDICTGTGVLLPKLSLLAKQTIGLDFTLPMLKAGKKVRELRDIPLIQGDALLLPLSDASVSAVTVAFGVRNFEDLSRGLQEILRILQPQGELYILEFGQPKLRMLRVLYQWYSKYIMPVVGGFFTGDASAYEYLPRTIATFPSGNAFIAIAEQCGYVTKRVIPLTFGVAYIYVLQKGRAE